MSSDVLPGASDQSIGDDRKHLGMFFEKMIDGFAYHKIIVDNSGMPIDYIFLEVNSAFERLTGLKRAEIIGKKVTQILRGIENDPANWIGVYGHVALTGESAEFENFAAGLEKWFKVSAYSPEIGYFVAIFEDVTERKKAEEALKSSEEQFRRAIADAPIPIIMHAEDGQILQLSKSWTELTGYTINDLPVFDALLTTAVYGEGADKVRNYMLALFKGNQRKIEGEFPIRTSNGETRYWSFSASSPGTLADGRRFVVGMAVDITDRRQLEKQLEDNIKNLEKKVEERTKEISNERQRLYNVLETLPAYVVLLDKDYRVPFANKVFRERFGESHGRRCHEYLFDRDLPCENCETYKVLSTKGSRHWQWTGPDGRNYDVFDYPFYEADGSMLILEMGIDITDQKKAEETAKVSAEKLKDAERLAAIGATAGMVGHDIRNPLQAIAGDIFLAKSDITSLPEGEAKESLEESLDSIQSSIDYINKIVMDLQDFARPLAPAAKETNLKGLVEEVLFKNGVPDNIEVWAQIEDKAKNMIIDHDLLKRVLSNLVTNAVQAMSGGGKLVVNAYREGEDIVITVSDTGVGVPEDVKGRLFTPLFTTKSKGQGFGLAVVKRMTEAMGGTVTFDSEIGKGTKFILRFPLANKT